MIGLELKKIWPIEVALKLYSDFKDVARISRAMILKFVLQNKLSKKDCKEYMKINRWMSEVPASKELVLKLLEQENLDAKDVTVNSGKKLTNMRTTMTEVIQIYSGELIFNLSGTQFVLRAGDRLQMSGNTVYSLNNMRDENAGFWFAKSI